MGNIRARTGYTVRYRGNTPTPQNLVIKMDSTALGDWIVLAIPYPQSALPFNVTSSKWQGPPSSLKQVFKLSDLEYATYYYDTIGEHLYLKLENYLRSTETFYSERWGFVDYTYNGISLTVQASCTNCTLSSDKVAIPAQIQTNENVYQAMLQSCQIPGRVESSGSGVGYFYLLPNRRELQFNIHHDLSEIATGVTLLQGDPKVQQRTIELKNSCYSPIRASVQLSHSEWTALVKGELYVKVSTKKNPNGELMGRIMCSGSSCDLPPIIPTLQTACAINQSDYFKIYNERSDLPGWPTWGFYTTVWPVGEVKPVANFSSTEQPLCGAHSLKLEIQKGAVTINHAKLNPTDPNYRGSPEIDTSKYDYFEFFVKSADGEAKINFQWVDMNYTRICSIDVTQKHISNYKIDSTAWSRVRVPLTEMNFSGIQSISGFSILLIDQSKMRTLFIDSIRFIDSTKYNDPFTTPPSSSILTKFKPSCVASPDPVTSHDPANSHDSTTSPHPTTSPVHASGTSGLSPIGSAVWMIALVVMLLL